MPMWVFIEPLDEDLKCIKLTNKGSEMLSLGGHKLSCNSEGDDAAFIVINCLCLLSLYDLLSGLETTYPFPCTTKVEAGATIAIWSGRTC